MCVCVESAQEVGMGGCNYFQLLGDGDKHRKVLKHSQLRNLPLFSVHFTLMAFVHPTMHHKTHGASQCTMFPYWEWRHVY